MSEKHSIAARKRLMILPKEVRSARARNAAKKRWAKTSKRKRRIHALLMVKARQTNGISR